MRTLFLKSAIDHTQGHEELDRFDGTASECAELVAILLAHITARQCNCVSMLVLANSPAETSEYTRRMVDALVRLS